MVLWLLHVLLTTKFSSPVHRAMKTRVFATSYGSTESHLGLCAEGSQRGITFGDI